jgi:uncharacterized protein
MARRLVLFAWVLLGSVCLMNRGFANVAKPQEPVKPYPYDEVEVSFTNPLDGVTLAGTLTLPRSKGPFPAVVLLHGSGPFNRNCSHEGHQFFLVWADHLTKQGIAVLRYDKRTSGKSAEINKSATLEEFAQDALSAVEYLKTRPEINLKQIGLIGHSEGGLAASLAVSKSQDVAFVVLMAAPAVNFEDLVLLQEKEIQQADGVSEETIRKSIAFRKQFLGIVRSEKDQALAEKEMQKAFATYLSSLTPLEQQIATTYYGPVDGQIQFFNSAQFRHEVGYNPDQVIKAVKVPVLALNGDLDFIVSSDQNLKKIEEIFKGAHHPDYTIKLLPNINHAFQTCETGSVKECGQLEETASPVVLKILSDWILEKTAKTIPNPLPLDQGV